MPDILPFAAIAPGDLEAVGGKGLSLGLMTSAGIPVPVGFCLTSQVHRAAKQAAASHTTEKPNSVPLPEGIRAALAAAYHQLGGGPVAVRSSATVEDGSAASFAGQQDTILGVQGEEELVAAVIRCWGSLDNERAVLYRRQQRIDEADVAMAVVVQRLIPAEISGVLFTYDPLDVERKKMLIEAAWGLGEAVVSGRVSPDRYHVDRQSGAAIDRHIATKKIEINVGGERAVEPERQTRACLDDAQLARLAELGRQIEAYYHEPRDIEWAWAEGQFWILQARPITTAGAFEREEVRREEMAALAARAAPGGTVWAKYNLAEVLPSPTPMTWGIVSRFMSGVGGFGLMYRDLGFRPEPIVDREGFIDLVCGRPYVNLSREARLNFPPAGYDFQALKAAPEKALYPRPGLDPARATLGFWLKLPWILFQQSRAFGNIARLSLTDAERLRGEVFPQFATAARAEMQTPIAGLASSELVARLEAWRQKTLNDFARHSLRPAVYASLAIGNLEGALTPALGAERAAAEVRGLLTGVHPDADADLPSALAAVAQGTLPRDAFLAKFGHRGSHEMELAHPRWSESPETLPQATPGQHQPAGAAAAADKAAHTRERWQTLAREANLADADRERLAGELARAQTYLGLREAAKHYLMLGYGVLRRILLELDARHKLGGGIFFLVPEELPRLVAGEKLEAIISARKTRRQIALSLECPSVVFSDHLEVVGRPAPTDGSAELSGTPVSAGVAEGPALVLTEPVSDPGVPDGFILVCPSTDPAWVPLFLRAKGLVLETGGILSHGAIVAREFGLPAVAGIDGVVARFQTGQRLRVDGNTGRVAGLP